MDTIFLYNQRKESFPTEVVRYFTINGKKYFIFTLNEKDANGYVQLYVSKIENEYGKLVMKNITDDVEWSSFKSAIQSIVTNNRNNIKNDTDLDYKELNNMIVTEFRIFKLKESVANELGENKNVKVNEPKKEPATLEAASAQSNNLSIEEILKQVSDGARSAKEETTVSLDTGIKPMVISSPEHPVVTPKPVVAPKTVATPIVEAPKAPINHPQSNNTKQNDTIDYKAKYEELSKETKKLELENMRLINDLVKAKAKIETVKDIVNN